MPAATSRALRWARRLLVAEPVRAEHWEVWQVPQWGQVVWSRGPAGKLWSEVPLVLSPGFGSLPRDYAPLLEVFGSRQPVARASHPGFERHAAFQAGLRLLWKRLFEGRSPTDAAIAVRGQIHHDLHRCRRMAQLVAAIEEIQRRTGCTRIDLAGHSYGSDTVLMVALLENLGVEIGTLYLFSPHPPGYLIERESYGRLRVSQTVVVTGSRDRTRDGVGPRDRLRVLDYLPPKTRSIVLDDVGHMDFAFSDIGSPDWRRKLRDWLDGVS